MTFASFWNNEGNIGAGGGFEHYALKELKLKKFKPVQKFNIKLKIDNDRDERITAAECNVFFDNVWDIEEERTALLARKDLIPSAHVKAVIKYDLLCSFLKLNMKQKVKKSTPFGQRTYVIKP